MIGLCFAIDVAEMPENTFPLIYEFSNSTEPAIMESPIKTWFLLLADTEAPYFKGLLESFRKVAGQDHDKLLYIIISKNGEKAAAKKYFGGVSYDPAIFLVRRPSHHFSLITESSSHPLCRSIRHPGSTLAHTRLSQRLRSRT